VLVGFFLLFVGALYAFARLFAAPAVVMLEERGGPAAIARAAALTRGSTWEVVKALMLVWLVYLIALVAAAFLSGIVLSLGQSLTALQVASQVVGVLFTVLVYPLISVVQTLLYYDLRIRKEGFDIELMAQRLEMPAPESAAY
jgi:hypothetical protein